MGKIYMVVCLAKHLSEWLLTLNWHKDKKFRMSKGTSYPASYHAHLYRKQVSWQGAQKERYIHCPEGFWSISAAYQVYQQLIYTIFEQFHFVCPPDKGEVPAEKKKSVGLNTWSNNKKTYLSPWLCSWLYAYIYVYMSMELHTMILCM